MAVAALCLFIEYAWSCAAVAVDWSAKLQRLDFNGYHLPEAPKWTKFPMAVFFLVEGLRLGSPNPAKNSGVPQRRDVREKWDHVLKEGGNNKING